MLQYYDKFDKTKITNKSIGVKFVRRIYEKIFGMFLRVFSI